jgi:hypothetical protein
LDPSRLTALKENASFLGRHWLSVLPSSKPLVLADREFSEALRLRMLIGPGNADGTHAGSCAKCGEPLAFLHHESCRGEPRGTASRHDFVRSTLARAYKAAGNAVLEEVALPNGLRTDIKVISPQGTVSSLDLTIVSLHGTSTRKRDPTAALKSVALEKINKYKCLGKEFAPVVLSIGGLMEKHTAGRYQNLQKSLPGASTYLDAITSITLVKSRVRPLVLNLDR